MGRLPTLLLTLGALLAAGCAQHTSRPAQGEDSSLQRWLDAELAPYLAEQLGRHPRFKGEPVMLVSLDGPDIQPDIDGLTAGLRERLLETANASGPDGHLFGGTAGGSAPFASGEVNGRERVSYGGDGQEPVAAEAAATTQPEEKIHIPLVDYISNVVSWMRGVESD